jgi:hypothetical protein
MIKESDCGKPRRRGIGMFSLASRRNLLAASMYHHVNGIAAKPFEFATWTAHFGIWQPVKIQRPSPHW